jgi:uncharacterized protein (TIGR03083 family)
VEVATHIEALRRDGELMASATAVADADAAVPTCPEWRVRDLVRHTGGVHRWATGYVADARTQLWNIELDDVVGSWPEDSALDAWLRDGCNSLAAALEAAPADLECWTFLRAPSPRAMWARRQAHETAIHRVDAELAAGLARSPFTADFAADGADELLTCFVPRRSTSLRAESPTTLGLACTDADASWTLRIDADGVTTTTGPLGEKAGGKEAACTVRGAAADLFLALWNRPGAEALSIEGDRAVLDLFGEAVQVRWA